MAWAIPPRGLLVHRPRNDEQQGTEHQLSNRKKKAGVPICCFSSTRYYVSHTTSKPPSLRFSRLCSSSSSSSSSNSNSNYCADDRDEEDPDRMGVTIDGFPLPSIPVRPDDEELLEQLNRVPLVPWNEPPIQPRCLSKQKEDDGNDHSKGGVKKPLRVAIAGGGLGGLALASTLIRNGGFDVHVYEQARRYKPFGGPIQIQSNALWALQQIHVPLYEAVRDCGVQTGDRLSGLKDGRRYEKGWLVKFDAATPARRKGLPLTLAINRVVLQDIFLKYGVPENRIHTSNRVIGYQPAFEKDDGAAVSKVLLEDGTHVYADLLVGADGIWSTVRHQMLRLPLSEVGPAFASKHARYSGYTCYTGTCQHVPSDIQEVAYKVFLGQEQYFGCTDAGNGWQHWWAFLPEDADTVTAPPPPPPRGTTPGSKKKQENNRNIENDDTGSSQRMMERLKHEFRDWSPEILDLFRATNSDVVQRRPLFDRPPMKGGWMDPRNQVNVVLMGDAAHPTMPNLGQGGAMAMEDAFVLGQELQGITSTSEIRHRLEQYQRRRFVRASIAQFLSRNGSDLLIDWDKLCNLPIVGTIAMWMINLMQPISMNYLYSSDI